MKTIRYTMVQQALLLIVAGYAASALFGCKAVDALLHPDAYERVDQRPVIKEILYDTVVVQVSENNFIQGVTKPSKEVQFTQIGQSVTVRKGETLRLVYDSIDVANSRLEGEFTQGGEVILRLVKRAEPVRLDRKCQTVVIFQTKIPQIEIDSAIRGAEQVIVTPRYNDDCQLVGYEVRYGSVERGCLEVAKEVLYRFQRCTEKRTVPQPPARNLRLKDIL